MPKQFLVFHGSTYYPSGGWDDYGQSFDSLEEAKKWIEEKAAEEDWDYDWAHVVDLRLGTVCFNIGKKGF